MPSASSSEDALVVGAGIAGLTFAAAWARHGGRARVLDREWTLSRAGGGVQLAPPAVGVLRRLGIDLGSAGAVQIEAQQVHGWRGTPITATALGQRCVARYGAPYLTVHRADLHSALYRIAADHAEVELGAGVRAVGPPADPVVSLDSGAHHEAPLVVGADGVRSLSRRSLVEDHPVFGGLCAYRAVVPLADLPAGFARPVVCLFVGPGAHVVTYPVSGARELNLVVVTRGDATAESWSETADPELLRSAFADWCDDVRAVLDRVTVLRRYAVHDRAPAPRLAQGRLALVGDAAHPMAPYLAQGANQAIEGAVELAAAMRQPGPGSDSDRLAAYSRRRLARATDLQRGSHDIVALLHLPDGPAQVERDQAWRGSAELAHRDRTYDYPVARLVGNAAASHA